MILEAVYVIGGRPGKPRASGDDPEMLARADDGQYVNPARAGMIRLSP